MGRELGKKYSGKLHHLCRFTSDQAWHAWKIRYLKPVFVGNMLRFCVRQKTKIYTFKIAWPCIVTDSLWIKPTDALNSNFIGITTLHVSGSLSAHHQEFLAVHRLWYTLCSFDDRVLPGAGVNCSSILLLVAHGHQNCIRCTNADVRLRTPDDGQKGCPKHIES